MTPRVGFPADMDPFALDPGTVERLVTGAADAGDAPPEYQAVAASLQALRSAPESWEWAGEPVAVERIAAAVVVRQHALPARRARRVRRPRARVARLAVAGVVALVLCASGGLASAGSLPEPAQNAASAVLGSVGISVPSGPGEPVGGEEPAATTADTVPPRTTSPAQPSSGAPAPDAGASPLVPASPGNGQGEVHGAPAQRTPPAKSRSKIHSPNGSPPADAGNGNGR